MALHNVRDHLRVQISEAVFHKKPQYTYTRLVRLTLTVQVPKCMIRFGPRISFCVDPRVVCTASIPASLKCQMTCIDTFGNAALHLD